MKQVLKSDYRKSSNTETDETPLPSEKTIQTISLLLSQDINTRKNTQKYASVKQILSILGTGATLSAALLAPKSVPVIKKFIQGEPEWDTWKHYNISYLRRTLTHLHKQAFVEIIHENNRDYIRLTQNGIRKILKFSIDTLSIKTPTHWDGKWRLVLYDVPRQKKNLGDTIRRTIVNFGFLAIQKSVYIYPYQCFDQVEYIRQYYGLTDCIQYMVVEHIEYDQAYKTYFNLS